VCLQHRDDVIGFTCMRSICLLFPRSLAALFLVLSSHSLARFSLPWLPSSLNELTHKHPHANRAGKTLRMYDFGRRKLLRKCENRRFPNFIVSIQSQVPLLLRGNNRIS
jgi:hypothetical protein